MNLTLKYEGVQMKESLEENICLFYRLFFGFDFDKIVEALEG